MKKIFLLIVIVSGSVKGFTQPCSGTPTAGIIYISPTTGGVSTIFNIIDSGYSTGTGITFQWQLSSDCVTWTNISGATNHHYTLTGITATTYFNCVVSCSNSGVSSSTGSGCSAGITYTTSVPEQNSIAQPISILPNPVANELFVFVDNNLYQTLHITNVLGKEILKQQITSNSTKVDVSDLRSGIYFMAFKGNSQSFVCRFVKE